MDAHISITDLMQEIYALKIVGEPELLHQRGEQQVFKVDLTDGSALVLRLCGPEYLHGKALAETRALQFLNNSKFPAPSLRLTTRGERAFEYAPREWGYAYAYITGEHVKMDIKSLCEVANLMATLHKLAHTPIEYPSSVNWLLDLEPSISNIQPYIHHSEWGQQVQEVFSTLQNLPDLTILPLGLIHTDIHEGNLLRDTNGKLWLLDWEDAGLGEMLLDIAVVLAWYCVWPETKTLDGRTIQYTFDQEYCRAFLESYQSVRRLEHIEAANLGSAIKFVTGWFAARDIIWEVAEPGSSEGEAWSNWAIMRSVTPEWEAILTSWALT